MPNETDTCRTFVVPKLQAAGWDADPHRIDDRANNVRTEEAHQTKAWPTRSSASSLTVRLPISTLNQFQGLGQALMRSKKCFNIGSASAGKPCFSRSIRSDAKWSRRH